MCSTPSAVCGTTCCEGGAVCGTNARCCLAEERCGGACCRDGRTCVAEQCVVDCGDAVACGAGDDAVCCGATQVCLLGACLDPGAECAGPLDCPEGQYCEASVDRCLPRDRSAGL